MTPGKQENEVLRQ